MKAAEANVALVQDALSYTELKSEAAGLITQRLGEVGQVVAPAQTIFTLAQDGDRDAVFNVFETLLSGDAKDVRVDVSLVSDPKVTTTATVRGLRLRSIRSAAPCRSNSRWRRRRRR